jgi:hypothetical protein
MSRRRSGREMRNKKQEPPVLQALTMERGMCKKTAFSEGCNSVVGGEQELFGPVYSVYHGRFSMYPSSNAKRGSTTLLSLSEGMLASLWPSSRLTMGLRVSKRLRAILLQGGVPATLSVGVNGVVLCRGGVNFQQLSTLPRVVYSSHIFCRDTAIYEDWTEKACFPFPPWMFRVSC